MSSSSWGLTPAQVYPVVAGACVGLLAIVLVIPIAPYDFWIHLASGRTIFETGHIPTVDTSLFTLPRAPIFDQPWLAQLLMYGLFTAGGAKLVLFAQVLLLGLTFAFLLAVMIKRTGGHVRASLAAMLLGVVPLTCPYWVVRPQTYTLPLFVAVLALTMARRLRWGWPSWPLVPLMALWANLHGTFVMGVGVLGLVAGVEGIRAALRAEGALLPREWGRLAFWATLGVLATLVNPRGIGIYGFAFQVAHSLNGSFGEWAAPVLGSPFGARFYVVALVELAVFVRWAFVVRRPPDPTDLLLWLVLFAASTTSCRYIVWAALASGPLVADAIAALFPRREHEVPVASRAGLAFVGAIGILVALGWWKRVGAAPDFEPYLKGTPVAAVERLRGLAPAVRPKRLFHNEGVGSYLLWAAPEQPIFIDPRFALYPAQQISDLVHLNNVLEVDALCAKYGFDGMLLDRQRQERLREHLARDPAWTQAYADDSSALFVRAANRAD